MKALKPLFIFSIIVTILVLILGCQEKTMEKEGLGGLGPSPYNPLPPTDNFGSTNLKNVKGEDLGGSAYYDSFTINWAPGDNSVDPIIDAMIVRLEHVQETTSGSQENQKKLYELVDLKRRLRAITAE
jgi:hypothetical protein